MMVPCLRLGNVSFQLPFPFGIELENRVVVPLHSLQPILEFVDVQHLVYEFVEFPVIAFEPSYDSLHLAIVHLLNVEGQRNLPIALGIIFRTQR